jgi:hypothetical protein
MIFTCEDYYTLQFYILNLIIVFATYIHDLNNSEVTKISILIKYYWFRKYNKY